MKIKDNRRVAEDAEENAEKMSRGKLDNDFGPLMFRSITWRH
jgi:hypothetical protein